MKDRRDIWIQNDRDSTILHASGKSIRFSLRVVEPVLIPHCICCFKRPFTNFEFLHISWRSNLVVLQALMIRTALRRPVKQTSKSCCFYETPMMISRDSAME